MLFSYRAKSISGQYVYGRLDAGSTAAAAERIREMGYVPLNLAPVPAWSVRIGPLMSSGIAQKEKIIFFRQFATMISAGISLSQALNILGAQTENKRFRQIVTEIANRVRGGESLSSAFAAQGKLFPEILPALLRTGEESGRLEEILQQFADALERKNELRQKIVTALVYPAAVILIALLVMGILVTVIIPQFEAVFANLNAEMPGITVWAFAAGALIRGHAGKIAAFLSLIPASLYLCARSGRYKAAADRIRLRLPIFGDIFRHASYARAFRSMHLLLSSGLAISEALELSGQIASNEAVRNDFTLVRRGVVMGESMHSVMSREGLFCPMVRHMVAVGEETGKADQMFEKLGLWHEAELTEKVRRLTSLLEPFVVVLVGLVVAFMAFSIFLPMISSIQNLI